MSTTQPIRDKDMLQAFKNYYLYQSPHPRNYALIIIGLNTALRINDILQLTWEAVYNRRTRQLRTHLQIKERKTGKDNRIYMNREIQQVLKSLMENPRSVPEGFLFQSSRRDGQPLSRYQAYRIIRRAAEEIGLEDVVRCHSLRKTFGYHAWKQGTPPALLMHIYNHSSYQLTKRYLCIEQDEQDQVYRNIRL